MKIQVQVKNVYGENKVYPICETAHTFAEIAGTKTITRHTLQRIAKLGYEIEHIQCEFFSILNQN